MQIRDSKFDLFESFSWFLNSRDTEGILLLHQQQADFIRGDI